MKKLIIAATLILATTSIHANTMSPYVGISVEQLHIADSPNLNKTTTELTLGLVDGAGDGVEISYTTNKTNGDALTSPYSKNPIIINDIYEIAFYTADIVYTFPLVASIDVTTNFGISKIKGKAEYFYEESTQTHTEHYNESAVHLYLGLSYQMDFAILLIGTDYYHNNDTDIYIPGAGVKLTF